MGNIRITCFAIVAAAVSVAMPGITFAEADDAGSSVQGIHGSGGRSVGIHGSGGRSVGIHGSGGRSVGIHGSGGRSVSAELESSSLLSEPGGSAPSRLFESVAMGPIEGVVSGDSVSGIVVLGQFFSTDVGQLATGDYVLAASADAFGENSVVTVLTEDYSPGISPVLLRAPVAVVDSGSASMKVGAVDVDYSAVLSGVPGYAPALGHLVEVTGTQPAAGGVILVGDQLPVSL